jgi:hypothetical protein
MTSQIIKLKGNLKSIKKESDLVKAIKVEIEENFQDLNSVKMNVDLINQICNVIESSKLKNKKEVFMKIYTQVFQKMNIDNKEIQMVGEIIEYLHSNNRIKAQSILSKLYRMIKNVVLKK